MKTEFNEKCEAFLKAMYSPSSKIQINEELLLNESIQWSRVIKEKIKHAINFSALRKALESDGMSFAIIQRAYKSISKIFNLVYSDLIENDYHSKIWREGTGIILKKPDKLNYSISKAYRIITLLNCLDKVAEKIIAVRLSYTAEINDKLLNFDQMKGRKQRSAMKNDEKSRKHAYLPTSRCQRSLWSCCIEATSQNIDQVKNIDQLNQLSKMFLTKQNYWLSIWRRTSEIKENKHRNITRLIYLAHFISNLYSILVFKDSRKVRKFTVTQLYWRRDAIHWGKEYWQECENAGKRSKNRFHMS